MFVRNTNTNVVVFVVVALRWVSVECRIFRDFCLFCFRAAPKIAGLQVTPDPAKKYHPSKKINQPLEGGGWRVVVVKKMALICKFADFLVN